MWCHRRFTTHKLKLNWWTDASVWSGICCTVRCMSPLVGHADPQIKVHCFIRKPESAAPNCGWGFITYLPTQPASQPAIKQTNKQTDLKLQWWYTPHAKFHLVSTSTAILTDTQNERRWNAEGNISAAGARCRVKLEAVHLAAFPELCLKRGCWPFKS